MSADIALEKGGGLSSENVFSHILKRRGFHLTFKFFKDSVQEFLGVLLNYHIYW